MGNPTTRRELMQASFLTGAGLLFGIRSSRGQIPISTGGFMSSPPVRPWLESLTIPPTKQPANVWGVNPVIPNNHQRYTQCYPQKFYELREQQALHSFHPDLPPNPIWGFDGISPGPVFKEKYGTPAVVRIYNDLPSGAPTGGFGMPSTSTHLHNLHCASESDGFARDYIDSGQYRDHHYSHVKAGFADPNTTAEQSAREALGTLFYHDHRQDFTGQNVYKGLVGMYMMFDDIDSNDETDPNPQALRLPSGDYDIPLTIQDKLFDSNGQQFYDQFNFDGILGDMITVNGKIQPYFQVDRRKYRFRLLAAPASRFFDFWLRNSQGSYYPLIHIANDGNLLPAPLRATNIRLAPAERGDVIIDFSQFKAGTELYLVNRAQQLDGRRPTGKLLTPGVPILKFVVKSSATPIIDPSRVPNVLRPLPDINLGQVVAERTWVFDRSNGAWAINGQFFNPNVIRAAVQQNTAEIWTLRNNNDGWSHPIHIHVEEFRILSRNGVAPPPHERGRKDVVVIGQEEVKIFIRFRDWAGRYLMHCHNLVHEDHAMMLRWDIVGPTTWG